MIRVRRHMFLSAAQLERRRAGSRRLLVVALLAAGCLRVTPAVAQTGANAGNMPQDNPAQRSPAHDNPFLMEQAAAMLPKLPKLPNADRQALQLSRPPAGPRVPSDVHVELVAINGRHVLLSISENGAPRLRRVTEGEAFYIKGQKYRAVINGLNVRIRRKKDIVWDMDLQGPPEGLR